MIENIPPNITNITRISINVGVFSGSRLSQQGTSLPVIFNILYICNSHAFMMNRGITRICHYTIGA